MIDDLRHYPAHLHRDAHTRACHAGTGVGLAIVLSAAFSVVAYIVGQHDGRADAQIAAATTPGPIGQCEQAERNADILEHTVTHRGQVIHRECIRIDRPGWVSPSYSVQTPARTM